jgi:hypothetical protein
MANPTLTKEYWMGPSYNFGDELATPSDLGIERSGSVDAIIRAVAGVNYYTDAIGFGDSTGLAKNQGWANRPLGIRFFTKTGLVCSNGADMYEYVNGIPSGLPGRVGKEVQRTLGVQFRGLAPGIVEDAVKAVNPAPLFDAAIGSGYPACKKVTLPVGDWNGSLKSNYDGKVWISEPTGSLPIYRSKGGGKSGETVYLPHQTRWMLDRWISQEEWDKTPKTETAGALPATGTTTNATEGFVGSTGSKVAAGVLFAALFFGLAATIKK